MRRKFLHIFTITLLTTCFVEYSAVAQEGVEIPEKQDTEVITEKDSTRGESTESEIPVKGDFTTPIVINPKEPRTLFPEGENVPSRTQTPGKKETTANEKEKDESSSNLKFNFIYYLFYKFKVGSSSTSGS